jgi:hypothetical protein
MIAEKNVELKKDFINKCKQFAFIPMWGIDLFL